MKSKNFQELIRLELGQYLSLPVLIFLISTAIVAVLAQPVNSLKPEFNYTNLYHGSGTIFLFLTFSVGAFLSRSFAGSLGKGEIKVLLSYPVRRWHLFLSKFLTMFISVFIIYGAAYSIHLYLYSLSIFEPMFYLSLFAFLLQIMLASAVSVAIAMVVKNEVMSMLAAVLILLGIDNIVGNQSLLSTQGRFTDLFGYVGQQTHGVPPFGHNIVISFNDFFMAMAIPLAIFIILFSISFVFFTRIMEVD
ncbi:MAG: ABC transporter permease subunit [Crenarchaeota archaeon]|nr:ABC transporter permease subunit [Thermoproteota archaeon]